MAESIIDELIRSRRKSVSLTITKDARLVVRAPLKLSLKELNKIIEQKKSWIVEKRNLAFDRLKTAQNCKACEGGRFLFLGRPLSLESSDKVKDITVDENRLLIPAIMRESANAAIIKWYRKQAGLILPKRLSEISQLTGIPYLRCSITSARRRWGSCNGRNNINLTWRLIMADPRAVDYVLVHELCHVIHKNHSKDFWNKVREIMPDYSTMRRWLKDNAYILDVFEV